jgi:hypothetical protein
VIEPVEILRATTEDRAETGGSLLVCQSWSFSLSYASDPSGNGPK